MMNKRKQALKDSNKALRESLENQLSGLKENFGDIGKNALWIGGGLIAVYSLVSLLSHKNNSKKKKKQKVLIQQPQPAENETVASPKAQKESFLSDTIKEQLIIFLLGLATQKLTEFLSDLDKKELKDDPN